MVSSAFLVSTSCAFLMSVSCASTVPRLRIERRADHARDRHEIGIVEEHLHLIGERGERGLEHEIVVRLVDEILQEAVELVARVGSASTLAVKSASAAKVGPLSMSVMSCVSVWCTQASRSPALVCAAMRPRTKSSRAA